MSSEFVARASQYIIIGAAIIIILCALRKYMDGSSQGCNKYPCSKPCCTEKMLGGGYKHPIDNPISEQLVGGIDHLPTDAGFYNMLYHGI